MLPLAYDDGFDCDTDSPAVTWCAYCGDDVVIGDACTCRHYWPDDNEDEGDV